MTTTERDDDTRRFSRLTGRLGAEVSWAMTKDRTARTAAGRKAADERFERQARELHPDGTERQILQAADALRRAHYTRMAIASAKARRSKGSK